MIHSRWSGTHYEAGLSYGQALREQGIDPFVHFRQSKARLAFTRASIPLYETFYPAVLDEIWGMADGAGLDRDTVATFLLSLTPSSISVQAVVLPIKAYACSSV